MPFLDVGAGARRIDLTDQGPRYWEAWPGRVNAACTTVEATNDDQRGRCQRGNQVERAQ